MSPGAERGLEPASAELLARLADRPLAAGFYLAGSAALACYLGHRRVRDLDLMSGLRRLRSPERRDILEDLLELEPAARVETARDGFLYARLPGGAALRLYYYPYPLVEGEEEARGFPLASLLDLALMKLGAVISRGARRDFVDIYLICRRLPLAEILERSAEKFRHVRDFPLQALKGLADLAEARGEPMPSLLAEFGWEEVEAWVAGEVRQLARRRVGLAAAGARPSGAGSG